MSQVTRIESVKVALEIKKEEADHHKDDIAFILGYSPSVNDGDSVHVSYGFSVEYLGHCSEKLNALSRLLSDKSIVTQANLQELEHGRCIIAEVMTRLTRIVDQLGSTK